jgi:cytochrome c biogenesis protein CcdA
MSGLIIPAFFADLLTFLSPCTPPLVRVYLAFISGGNKERKANTGGKIFWTGVTFVFSFVFITLGVIARLLGSAFVFYQI